ncbi:MAG TPA: hypothetical protein VMT58_01445 [Candidatus Binataceae bacterium]|nr:hypothetical protein [Candidatus Binataceae bacterium]
MRFGDLFRSRIAAAARIGAAVFLVSLICPSFAGAQDDWEVLKTTPTPRATPVPRTAPKPGARNVHGKPGAPQPPVAVRPAGPLIACGEKARPAGETYVSIMAQLNDMWGTNFRIYESLQPGSPHARAGGCIFYNEQYLQMLMQKWMNINDPDAMRPMLIAIFAHETGHLAHGDFDPGTTDVPVRNKELAADQFAGYTMERLGIARLDPDQITRYYELTGDDFVGAGAASGDAGHGSGSDRMAAFDEGWKRAKMGLSEQSDRPAGGLGEP